MGSAALQRTAHCTPPKLVHSSHGVVFPSTPQVASRSRRTGALRPPGATPHTFEGRQWVPLEEAQREAEDQFQAGLEAGRQEAGPQGGSGGEGAPEGAAHSLTLDERTRLVSTVGEVIEAARAEQVQGVGGDEGSLAR